MKRRTYLALFLTLILGGGIAVFDTAIFFSESTLAASYESEQDIAFTFSPTVSLTVSGDLAIESLSPGDYKDSNIITVVTSSNGSAGYSLSSTVGGSTNASTELRLNGTDTTNKFSSLTANAASLSDFSTSASTWGYSWCSGTCNAGTASTSWVSGSVGSTSTGYNGLPVYTTSSPIQLVNSAAPGSSTISFKIGARSTTTQIAGAYTNVINFIGVSNVVTTSYTINYVDNSSAATDMPSQQTGTTTTGAVTLSSTQPVRTDYIFKGWCTVSTNDGTCSGTTIMPGGIYDLNSGTSTSVTKTVYAMWESNSQ